MRNYCERHLEDGLCIVREDVLACLLFVTNAANELKNQAWDDGDGYSMKVDGNTFAHLCQALESLEELTA